MVAEGEVVQAAVAADAVSGGGLLAGIGGPIIAIGCGLLFFSLLFGSMIAVGVFALNNSDPKSQAAANTLTSATPVAATTWTMPKTVLKKIQSKEADYQAAAAKANVPWQLLAGINYRECSLADCGPSGESMGTVNPDSHSVECPVSVGYVACLGKIADHVRAMAKSVYGVKLSASSSGQEIQLAMLAYNRGYMYKTGHCTVEESPYVFNQIDAAHHNMRWPNNSCEPSSTQGKVNIPAGGFTIYSYLVNHNI